MSMKARDWRVFSDDTYFQGDLVKASRLDLLEDPVLLPAQEPARYASRAERDLMAAVLERACADVWGFFVSGTTRKKQAGHRLRALAWFCSSDRTWLFSFLSICEHLGLDGPRIRRRIVEIYNDARRRPANPVQRRSRGTGGKRFGRKI